MRLDAAIPAVEGSRNVVPGNWKKIQTSKLPGILLKKKNCREESIKIEKFFYLSVENRYFFYIYIYLKLLFIIHNSSQRECV